MHQALISIGPLAMLLLPLLFWPPADSRLRNRPRGRNARSHPSVAASSAREESRRRTTSNATFCRHRRQNDAATDPIEWPTRDPDADEATEEQKAPASRYLAGTNIKATPALPARAA